VTQLWNLTYSGTHSGRIKLVFHYDAALLPPGYDQSKLIIRHFTNGAWEQLVGKVDTESTPSPSPQKACRLSLWPSPRSMRFQR